MRIAVHLESDDAWRLTFTQCHAIVEAGASACADGAARRLPEDRDDKESRPPSRRVRYADFIGAELSSLDSVEDGEFWRSVVQDNAS